MAKTKKAPKLKPKKVKGRIAMLKALPYKGIMVYLRRIDEDIFEYIIPFEEEIYSDYIIIAPPKGRKKLTKDEITQAAGLALSGAITTIDYLLGETTTDKKTKATVKAFEGSRKQAESLPN